MISDKYFYSKKKKKRIRIHILSIFLMEKINTDILFQIKYNIKNKYKISIKQLMIIFYY